MITISGVNITRTGSEAPTLYDIGYHLSKQPRYGGATIGNWTVFHHLLACWYYATETKKEAIVALYALLHDAHEAITCDIPQPWKTDDMRELQRQLDVRIYNSLGLSLPDLMTERAVHYIDNQMVYFEALAYAPQVAEAMRVPGDNYRNGINVLDEIAPSAVRWAAGWVDDSIPHACGMAYEEIVKEAKHAYKLEVLKSQYDRAEPVAG